MSTPTDAVRTEVRGRVLVITLNRPEVRNAINAAVADGLAAAVERLDATSDLLAGVLHGAGRTFCSGMDLGAFATEGLPRSLDVFLVDGARKPLVAAVEGHALAGGLELALVCDLIVASAGAKLGVPEVKVGLAASGGALIRLPRRLPWGLAAELALTGRTITAEEAHTFRLVSRVAERGHALETALELASEVAANAPLAVIGTKQILRSTSGLTEQESWREQQPVAAEIFRSDDAREGPRAFAQQRPPAWTGR